MRKERIIKYSKDEAKFIKNKMNWQKKRLREAIEGLKKIPMTGDIRTLEGYKDGRIRLRVGSFRVILKK